MKRLTGITLAVVLALGVFSVVGLLNFPAAPAVSNRPDLRSVVSSETALTPQVKTYLSVEPTNAPIYAPRGVVVTYLSAPSPAAIAKFAKTYGISPKNFKRGSNPHFYSIMVPTGMSTDALIAKLSRDSAVANAGHDYISRPAGYAVPTNDPSYSYYNNSGVGDSNSQGHYQYARSWWLRDSGINTFWNNYNNGPSNFPTRTGSGTFKIAVIDTGFYMTHPDKGVNIVAGKDECQTYSNGTLTTDYDVTPMPGDAPMNTIADSAHGTCVAGEIAAATNNATGVASVGYDNQVVVYKVMGIWVQGNPLDAKNYPPGCPIMPNSAITNAIYDATDAGCKIINLSLGSTSYDAAEQTAINYAYAHGVVVVAAAGNNGNATNFYPAACANVVGVGSYDLNASNVRVRSGFSNYGSQLDVLAPGVLIYGLSAPDYTYGPVLGYTYWDGTSMASPIFAGSLAMLWRFAPSLTNAEITDYMLKSATPDVANTAQPNTSYGYGYMNVAGAYAKLKADFPYLARPSITTTQVAYASQNINLAWGSVTATRSVQYQVVRDAGVPTTQTTTALALSNAALSEGTHTVTVTPQSSYNWYDSASDTATYTFTVDRTAPTVSGISYASNLLSWNDGEGTATHTAQVHIDAAATQTISANSYAITPGTLADGSHTLYIAETDAVGNTSSIYSYAFNYVNPPLAPVLSPSYSCADAPYTLSWTADPTASYECVLNGGATSTVPGGSIALSLNQGSNSVQLRSVKGNLASAWVTSTVSFIPPRPAAPAISPIADAHTPNQAVSWTAVPYALSYEYRINGSAATGTTATTTVFSGLVEGSNIIEVRSLNYSGYSTSWASATVIYYPPLPGAPTLPTFPGVATPNVSLSWPIATYASSYDWRINGGSISNIAAASLSTGGLVEGANLVEVRSHNYSGTSAWSTQTVIYSPPLPAAPTLGSIADVSVPSASFSWTAVSYATSYDYQLNGGAVLSTTGTTAALSGLSQGPNVIQVRSRNYSGTSTGWGSATVIYRPPLPVAPAVPTIADVSLPSVTFSWSAVPYATSYEVSLNGADPQTVSSPSITLSGLIEGINSVEVRARDYSGIGPWSAASFSYNPPLPGVPVLPTLAGVSTPSVSFSWPAVSYASSYEYRLNGGGPISVAVTGATATNLVEGPNSIELRSRNYSGVSAWSVAKTVIYTPPLPAAPVIAPLADVSVSSVSFSWAAVPYATSYDYRLGSAGTVLSTATTGAMLSGLLEGANSVQLRSHNYAGSSAWTSVSVVYRPPLPVAPTLPTLAEVSAPSTSLSWASATYATSYDWRLNGGSITNTVTRTLALTGLSKGSNLVEVRSHNYSGTSGWASRSFSFVPPVPPAPAVNPSTNPVPGGVVVSWASAANAVSYEVETNGSASGVTTSALSTMVTSLVDGDNTIRVRAWNAYGDAGPWSDSLTVVKPVFYSLSSLASAPTVSYGGTGTSISANVRGSDGAPAVGVVLTVQYSYDAKIWSTLTTLNTDALGNANYAYQPSRIVYVRVSAAGNDHYLATTGPALRLLVSPSMGIPSTPAKVTHSRSFTIYGYLKPRHASGAKNVSLKIYRQVSGKWKLYKTVSAKNANYSSYTKYSVSTSVPYKGSWRVYAYYAGTSSFAAFTTGYRTFSAK